MSEFTPGEWRKAFEILGADEKKFGMPERRADSVVLCSFNIRKLGKVKNKSRGAWDFLAHFCSRCDLIAVQEVQDDLEALQYLKGLMGDAFGLVVSDAMGGVPGRPFMRERLAYLFHWSTVRRTEVASDISFERSFVLDQL